MTNPTPAPGMGPKGHSWAIVPYVKSGREALIDGVVRHSFELQKAEVSHFSLAGRATVLACNSGKGTFLKTSGLRVFIPEESVKLLQNFSRLSCAARYLSKLRLCDHFSGLVLAGSGVKPLICEVIQPAAIDQKAFDFSTPFNIQSVGKLFTQAAILQLVEDKVLELDQPIASVLTEDHHYEIPVDSLRLSPGSIHKLKSSYVTIRDLVTHQGGLTGGVYIPRDKAPPFVTFDESDIGTFSYSNTGYALLARIIEQVRGMSFTDYVKDNIFKRSGIADEDSIKFLDSPPLPHEVPVGFDSLRPSGEIIEDGSPYQSPYGNGCFWMLPLDLYKFGRALQSGKLFKDSVETHKIMLSLMEVSEDEHGVSYGHQGGAVNGSTDFTIIEPADGSPAIISIVMSNFSGGNDAGIEMKIAIKSREILPPLGPQMSDIHFVKAFMGETSEEKRRELLTHFFKSFPPFDVAMRICDGVCCITPLQEAA